MKDRIHYHLGDSGKLDLEIALQEKVEGSVDGCGIAAAAFLRPVLPHSL